MKEDIWGVLQEARDDLVGSHMGLDAIARKIL